MKKLLLITLALTSIIGAKAQDTTFTSTTQNFTITYPTSWSLMDKAAFPILEFGALAPRENEEDKFSENVNVVIDSTPMAKGMSTTDYRDANVSSMKLMLQEFKLVNKSEDKTTNSTKASTLTYSHSANGFNITALTYICKVNGRFYVITCSATNKEFDRYQPTFLTICRSIVFN